MQLELNKLYRSQVSGDYLVPIKFNNLAYTCLKYIQRNKQLILVPISTSAEAATLHYREPSPKESAEALALIRCLLNERIKHIRESMTTEMNHLNIVRTLELALANGN